MMRLGVIADDATGGTDLASVLRRGGATVVQTFGVPSDSAPEVDAVVVSLKTRTAPASVAVAESAAAAAWLSANGASQLYFKYCSTFDSTDRGNIGPVIDGLLDLLGLQFTVACPAYPEQGRTIYCGHLFVGHQLLSESAMRQHPLTPMTDANLVRVLGRQSHSSPGLVPLPDVEAGVSAIRARFDALLAAGHRVALVDALTNRHVGAIAEACTDLRFVTGGAALGGALGARGAGAAVTDEVRVTSPVVILSGSCSAATRQQIDRVAGAVRTRSIDPHRLAVGDGELEKLSEWACDQTRQGDLLLFSTASPEDVSAAQQALGRDRATSLVEAAFRHLARTLAAAGVRTFVVAGGETSGAVLESLGIRMLRIGPDVESGVPWTVSIAPEGYTLALKSGNFGSPDFFLKALGRVA
jgi:3-dehydrotetronate 4-kinase